MLIAWDNKADAASLSADSEESTLPAANVQQPHVSRKWYTLTGVKSAYLLLDLGSSLSCGLLALLGTNFTTSATVRLRGSVTDVTATGSLAYDSGTVSAGIATGYGGVYKPFAATASRYWRLDLADATVDDHLEVGRLFLGPKWTPSVGMLYDWSITPMDPSKVAKSYGGQSFPENLPKLRVLDFVLDYLTEAEMYDNAFAMARAQGVVKDVLAIPFESGSYIPQQSAWGLLTAMPPLRHKGPLMFTQKFQIEERL